MLRNRYEQGMEMSSASSATSAVKNPARRFREAYGQHRAAEGRAHHVGELLALPYIARGPLARQWRVRARTFEGFVAIVLEPRAAEVAPRPLRVVDLGAGNGWLCYRVAQRGHHGVAIDTRTDAIDGLAAAAAYGRKLRQLFGRVAASFDAVPLASQCCDIAVFNASLHYALDLPIALTETARILVPGGRIAIMDSPFYESETAGQTMVEEKRARAEDQFGGLAEDLMALPFIEFLTPARLETASASLGLEWRCHRVRYPLWYEARPLLARLRGSRTPSRFDLWEAVVP